MSAKTFTYTLMIRESHLDTFGHVNNATYLSLLEEARWELITNNGYGYEQIQESGIGPTILEVKLRFLRELRLRETIQIETRMISYTGKIGQLAQSIIRNGDVCCTAEFSIGLFSMQERKLIPPTPEWLYAIGLE